MKRQVVQQQSQSEEDLSDKENITMEKIPKTMNLKIVFEEPSPTGIVYLMEQGTKETIQLIEQFPIGQRLDNSLNLSLKSILYELSENYNISFENKQIHYYLEDQELYMNCGIEPLSQDIKIHPRDYLNNKDGIRIKAKKMKNIMILHKLMSVQNPIQNEQQKQRQTKDQSSKSRRTKQRRIGYIIKKVIEWRQLYHGKQSGKNEQLSLQEAAQQVNISKKSLDDYLFQIRFGNKYHFNFNQHYNDKVGVLRDFVRSKKKADKAIIKNKIATLLKDSS